MSVESLMCFLAPDINSVGRKSGPVKSNLLRRNVTNYVLNQDEFDGGLW